MRPEPDPDLSWMAFQYASGELPAAEEATFEARLAEDQGARDAVALAVELALALALVAPEFRGVRRSTGRRSALTAVALAMAAGLVLAIVPRLLIHRPERVDDSAVALAWSNLRSGLEPVAVQPRPAEEFAEEAGEEEDAEIDLESPAGRPLPSWLLSAASTRLDETPREED